MHDGSDESREFTIWFSHLTTTCTVKRRILHYENIRSIRSRRCQAQSLQAHNSAVKERDATGRPRVAAYTMYSATAAPQPKGLCCSRADPLQPLGRLQLLDLLRRQEWAQEQLLRPLELQAQLEQLE